MEPLAPRRGPRTLQFTLDSSDLPRNRPRAPSGSCHSRSPASKTGRGHSLRSMASRRRLSSAKMPISVNIPWRLALRPSTPVLCPWTPPPQHTHPGRCALGLPERRRSAFSAQEGSPPGPIRPVTSPRSAHSGSWARNPEGSLRSTLGGLLPDLFSSPRQHPTPVWVLAWGAFPPPSQRTTVRSLAGQHP